MLCLVIDRAVLRAALAYTIEAAVAAGVDWVQVRERALDGEALAELTQRVQAAAARGSAARAGSARVIVNRRTDVALACAADGVHLGFDAAPASVVRQLMGEEALIGRSIHAAEEVDAQDDIDYVQLAPIAAPLSKRSEREALGLAEIRRAAACGIPVIAQGGIDVGNARAALQAGASGIAVTGAILMQPDPGAATRALRSRLDA